MSEDGVLAEYLQKTYARVLNTLMIQKQGGILLLPMARTMLKIWMKINPKKSFKNTEEKESTH